jgi:hypothetical protein
MKLDDLKNYERMLSERNELLSFMSKTGNATHIGIFIPSWYDLETGRYNSEVMSSTVMIDDKTIMAEILQHARSAAPKRIKEIEDELTKAGIEF